MVKEQRTSMNRIGHFERSEKSFLCIELRLLIPAKAGTAKAGTAKAGYPIQVKKKTATRDCLYM